MKKKPVLLAVVCCLILAAALAYYFRDPIIDWLPIDQSGWDMTENGEKSYLDEDGDPVTGWQKLNSNTYYFDPETGAMATGWLELEEGRYYLGDDGIPKTGWQTIDGARYYLGDDGIMRTGWLELKEGLLYLNEQGNPHTGWLRLEDDTYYLNESFVMHTGWLELDGQRYYLNEDGTLHTGWLEQKEGKYYLSNDGILQTGWLELDGQRYYLDEDGIIQTGWLELGEQKYYLKEDGAAAKGRLVIDDETFYFTSTGANIILVNRWNLLPPDFEPEIAEPVPDCLMDVRASDATLAMLTDLQAATGDTGFLNGYRTYGAQYRGFFDRVNEMVANGSMYTAACDFVSLSFAYPGASEHQLGMAVDIMGRTDLRYESGDNAVVQWLKEHCWEYGFILRYPDNKAHITGIIYEPWHYRYVGVDLAMELKDTGLCLEEYLDALTNDGTTCGNPKALASE